MHYDLTVDSLVGCLILDIRIWSNRVLWRRCQVARLLHYLGFCLRFRFLIVSRVGPIRQSLCDRFWQIVTHVGEYSFRTERSCCCWLAQLLPKVSVFVLCQVLPQLFPFSKCDRILSMYNYMAIQWVIINKYVYCILDVSARCSIVLCHSLDSVFVGDNVHYRHTWDFTNTSFKVFIAGCNNVTAMLLDTIDDTVICVGAFMGAF